MMRTVIVIGMMIVAPLVGANNANDEEQLEDHLIAAALAQPLLEWLLDKGNETVGNAIQEMPQPIRHLLDQLGGGLFCMVPSNDATPPQIDGEFVEKTIAAANRGHLDIVISTGTKQPLSPKSLSIEWGWGACSGMHQSNGPYFVVGDPDVPQMIVNPKGWAAWGAP